MRVPQKPASLSACTRWRTSSAILFAFSIGFPRSTTMCMPAWMIPGSSASNSYFFVRFCATRLTGLRAGVGVSTRG